MLDPIVICRQKTFLKNEDNLNIKDYPQYNRIHNTGLRARGDISILIRNYVPKSKIELKTDL